MRNQKRSTLHPSNCAVLTLRKIDKQKQKKDCVHFSYFYLRTFVCGRFYMLHSFSQERCLWCRRFCICLGGEREKQCPGERLPLNVGELIALSYPTLVLNVCPQRRSRVRILMRVRESTLAKTPANESTRVQLDSRKLSDVSHKLNTGESKDSCKLHLGESKWTLVALYESLPLRSGETGCPWILYTVFGKKKKYVTQVEQWTRKGKN